MARRKAEQIKRRKEVIRMKKILFMIVAITLMTGGIAFSLPGSKTYMASWTANTETDLNGYYLYWRTSSGSFSNTNRIACAKTATTQVLTGLVPNNTIIALTAFDVAGNESAFSAEVPFVGDSSAPSAPAGLKIELVP
jgi:hypothetical protein